MFVLKKRLTPLFYAVPSCLELMPVGLVLQGLAWITLRGLGT